MPRRHLARSVAALLAVSACTTTHPVPVLPLVAPAPAAHDARRSYVLTSAELSTEHDRWLSEVIASRWPDIVYGDLPRSPGTLRPFDAGPNDRFGVYDARGSFLGGPDYLTSVRPSDVQQIRRLTSMEEFATFGRGHPAGAVVLTWLGGTH
jgi:hypothetical protein